MRKIKSLRLTYTVSPVFQKAYIEIMSALDSLSIQDGDRALIACRNAWHDMKKNRQEVSK